jgi:hypothetical protein
MARWARLPIWLNHQVDPLLLVAFQRRVQVTLRAQHVAGV